MFLCYYAQFPVSDAVVSLPLTRLIQQTNQRQSYFMGRSAKLNWLCDDIKHQAIHKPILLDSNLKTVTGDTRLWACDLLGISHIPALVYCYTIDDTTIHSMDDFYRMTGIPLSSTVTWGPRNRDFFTHTVDNYNVYHQESADMIGGYQSHRMFVSLEDRHWRTRVMWNYFNQYPDVVIDRAWYLNPVDWQKYY